MTRIIVHNHLPKRRTRDASPEAKHAAGLPHDPKTCETCKGEWKKNFKLMPRDVAKDALGPKDPKWKTGGNAKPLSTMQITASVEPKIHAILQAVERGAKKAREAIAEVNAIAAGVRREVEALGGDQKEVVSG